MGCVLLYGLALCSHGWYWCIFLHFLQKEYFVACLGITVFVLQGDLRPDGHPATERNDWPACGPVAANRGAGCCGCCYHSSYHSRCTGQRHGQCSTARRYVTCGPQPCGASWVSVWGSDQVHCPSSSSSSSPPRSCSAFLSHRRAGANGPPPCHGLARQCRARVLW